MSAGFSLPDLFDANEGILVAAMPVFSSFGGADAFCGQIRTIKCHEDNSLVAERLREAGDGAVMVVDGGASLRCALLGDNLAAIAADNGWAGILINGCVRDLPELHSVSRRSPAILNAVLSRGWVSEIWSYDLPGLLLHRMPGCTLT